MKAKYSIIAILFFIICLPGLIACTQSEAPVLPSDSPTAANTLNATATTTQLDSSCESETEMTFEDWPQWTKVNKNPITGHDAEWTFIHVDDLAEATYLAATAPYPECATIVKAEYTDSSLSTVSKLAIMVKMSAGYDPDHADWWYGMYDQTGTKASMQGKIAFCIECHKDASATDYLFSKEVLEASME